MAGETLGKITSQHAGCHRLICPIACHLNVRNIVTDGEIQDYEHVEGMPCKRLETF